MIFAVLTPGGIPPPHERITRVRSLSDRTNWAAARSTSSRMRGLAELRGLELGIRRSLQL